MTNVKPPLNPLPLCVTKNHPPLSSSKYSPHRTLPPLKFFFQKIFSENLITVSLEPKVRINCLLLLMAQIYLARLIIGSDFKLCICRMLGQLMKLSPTYSTVQIDITHGVLGFRTKGSTTPLQGDNCS